MPRKCYYCGTTTKELRPYGPKGADVCYPCGTSPEHEQETKAAFGALLDANTAISPLNVVVIGSDEGPQPFNVQNG